jgi:hypothetical protein
VDIELPTVSVAEHRLRLAWFEQRKGAVLPMAELMVDGMQLANKPKGIFKPADLQYALSIRANLSSEYEDGTPVPLMGGGWTLRYHQEKSGPAERDRLSANIGLMRCMHDQVPVGVLQQVGAKGRQSQYEVMGLATPVRWEDDYFYFVSMDAKYASLGAVQEAVARTDFEARSVTDIPKDDYDARLRVQREIVARQGQARFRSDLVNAYQGRCAVTRCDATMVLEAAHLRPYRGPGSNAVNNGLLLRADIHTLLDLRLLALEPDQRTVGLSRQLAGTQYEAISGMRIAEPSDSSQRPARQALESVWRDFQEAESGRRQPR